MDKKVSLDIRDSEEKQTQYRQENAGFPVHRLDSLDELPRGKGEVYLLCPEFPQSAEFSWKNLLRGNYTYNERPLALWKGTPRRPPRVPEEPEGDAEEESKGEKL